MKNNLLHKAFTLIEILIIISIIGLITSLSLVSFSNIREKSRDTKRIADIKIIQKALEDYYRDEGVYPTTLNFGEKLMGKKSSTTYLEYIPQNPSPRNDGNCPDSEYVYTPTATSTNYGIEFCLSKKNNDLIAGENCATAQGIKNGSCF